MALLTLLYFGQLHRTDLELRLLRVRVVGVDRYLVDQAILISPVEGHEDHAWPRRIHDTCLDNQLATA